MKKFLSSMDSKKKSTLVKVLAVSLVIVLVVVLYAIPKGSPAPKTDTGDTQATAERLEEEGGLPVVTVLMDLPTEAKGSGGSVIANTLAALPGYERDFTVWVEPIPASGSERESLLTRYRLELVAGKGPDLLLCAQPMAGLKIREGGGQAFFQFPEQLMESHLLLPLDDYIENAEYMNWDELQPLVMEAGRNEEGQQFMPLSYTFTVHIFDKDYTPDSEFPMTWEEMARDPDPAIRFAAVQTRLADVIGNLADFSKDAPAFTEEELYEWATLRQEAGESLPEEMEEEQPCYTLPLDLDMLDGRVKIDLFREEYTIIPAYNTDGGVTASVTTFAAISRNARQPDLAFKLIDYMMQPKVQQVSPLFQGRMDGMPVYVNTGDENTPPDSYWRMTENNFRQVRAAQEQINVVRFYSPLDECLNLVYGADEKTRKETSHQQYVEMKMYLCES